MHSGNPQQQGLEAEDDGSFLRVYADGSIGSCGWSDVFPPSQPDPTSTEPKHRLEDEESTMSFEDLLDSEIDAANRRAASKRPAQRTMDELLQPKGKKKTSKPGKPSQPSFDFKKAFGLGEQLRRNSAAAAAAAAPLPCQEHQHHPSSSSSAPASDVRVDVSFVTFSPDFMTEITVPDVQNITDFSKIFDLDP